MQPYEIYSIRLCTVAVVNITLYEKRISAKIGRIVANQRNAHKHIKIETCVSVLCVYRSAPVFAIGRRTKRVVLLMSCWYSNSFSLPLPPLTPSQCMFIIITILSFFGFILVFAWYLFLSHFLVRFFFSTFLVLRFASSKRTSENEIMWKSYKSGASTHTHTNSTKKMTATTKLCEWTIMDVPNWKG